MVMKNFTVFTIYIILSFIRTSTPLDTISQGQPITDGDNLVSGGGTFELGFFSLGKSKRRYLGIWYKDISPLTVVWVANRETPLTDTRGVLDVNDRGILVLLDGTNRTIWSSNSSIIAEKSIAQLLDSGNLIVRYEKYSNEGHFLWQSFDYPCDTLLPGMKLGWNLVTGLNRFLSSWRSPDDPGQGEHVLKIDHRGYPQSFQMRGNVIQFRGGLWNGLYFTGYPVQKLNPVYEAKFILNDKEAYYEYELMNRSVFSRIVMTPSGIGQRLLWSSQRGRWEIISANMADQCENYALCGANSICNFSSSRVCECLKGFVPKNREEWNISDWSNGCVQSTKLVCNNRDGFQKYRGMKLPDSSSSQFNKTMTLEECRQSCLKNCSCTAYANLDIRDGGRGCLLWFNDLIDMKQLPQGGQDLFIRVPASELDLFENKGPRNINKGKLVEVAVGSVMLNMGTVLIIYGLITCLWKKKLKKPGMTRVNYTNPYYNKLRKEDMDLQIFDFSVIAKATCNFSSTNKLGEGGFGPVYKGNLIDGQEIAVKRLSKDSGQGMEEFKNEVVLIAKLQHRNLVKLIGCCIEGEEKMLIYEYMSNKSLDYLIFDETGSKLLDWTMRFCIINGIARGLVYLHQDSRLRIIHRDLKTSNILLDNNLNPKISDFGLARTFWGDQIEAKTNRVAGTYGYMPPEYAVHGHFSVKSDVFSFGVIVLEIISGKKNREFSDQGHSLNLLGYAWGLWSEGRALELMDQALGERCNPSEVIQCIQVGLLCVQQRPEDRPEISSVVLMLNGEKSLPNPKVPAFYIERNIPEADSSSAKCKLSSPNEMSLTVFEAR